MAYEQVVSRSAALIRNAGSGIRILAAARSTTPNGQSHQSICGAVDAFPQ